jgi:hypothetical protein
MTDWLAILQKHVDQKGSQAVIRELDISATTLSLVLRGKYQASTERIEQRVMAIYGEDGKVICPILGQIEPSKCIDNYQRAQAIRAAGNPATIRLYMACRKCTFR